MDASMSMPMSLSRPMPMSMPIPMSMSMPIPMSMPMHLPKSMPMIMALPMFTSMQRIRHYLESSTLFMATSARHVYVYVCFHVYACGSKTRGGMLGLKYVCIHVHIHMYAYKDKALVRIEHLVHGRLLCRCRRRCLCLWL